MADRDELLHDWLDHGIDAGFCSEITCIQHDGTPFTDLESKAFDRGDDPCIPMIRLYRP
jgi:hypothetical protein